MERMDQGFAVFNLHKNDGGNKADAEFIAQFGQDEFDAIIKPLHAVGIMSIFNTCGPRTSAWIALCTYFVNAEQTAEATATN